MKKFNFVAKVRYFINLKFVPPLAILLCDGDWQLRVRTVYQMDSLSSFLFVPEIKKFLGLKNSQKNPGSEYTRMHGVCVRPSYFMIFQSFFLFDKLSTNSLFDKLSS